MRPDLTQLGASVGLTLVSEPPLTSARPLAFKWSMKNTTPIAVSGRMRLLVDGSDRVTPFPPIASLPSKEETGGTFDAGPHAPGEHSFRLEFQLQTGEQWDAVGPSDLRKEPTYAALGASEVDVTIVDANPPLSFECPTDFNMDRDKDCLDDRIERALLDTYTPYYKFSMEAENRESRPPTDIGCYLAESEVILDGNMVVPIQTLRTRDFSGVLLQPCPSGGVDCSPDVTKNPRLTDYTVRRLNDSCAWSDAVNNKTGLYGHVVPYDQLSPQGEFQRYFDDTAKLFEGDPALGRKKRFIKIEYWQFFAYNGWSFPHQGDWTTVQLLVDLGATGVGLTTRRPCQASPSVAADLPQDSPLRGEVAAVFHYAHGKVEFRFDLDKCTGAHETEAPNITELRGPNYTRPECPGVAPSFICEDHNVVQFFKVGTEPTATHPVVYLEFATHEYFPTGSWMNYFGMPNHKGTDETHRYLAAAPPNLGEVEAPLGEEPLALIIMRFNGQWGVDPLAGADGPRGPALHAQWTWPRDSTIRWQLRDLGY